MNCFELFLTQNQKSIPHLSLTVRYSTAPWRSSYPMQPPPGILMPPAPRTRHLTPGNLTLNNPPRTPAFLCRPHTNT
jgi:hypothetical protein